MLFHIILSSYLIYNRVKTLEFPQCNNSRHVYQKLGRGIFFFFFFFFLIRKKRLFRFKLYTSYLQEKSNHKKSHAHQTDPRYSNCLLKKSSYLQHFLQREHLQACKRSDFLFWKIFPISSPPSTTILKDSHILYQ